MSVIGNIEGTVVLPDKVGVDSAVVKIGGLAFANCTSLTGIVIPATVTHIDDTAFNGCSELRTVYCLVKTAMPEIYETYSAVFSEKEPCGEGRFWHYDGANPAMWTTAGCTHSYEYSVTREPTCTAHGEGTYVCSVCSHGYTVAIAKTEHSYTTHKSDGENEWDECVCGEKSNIKPLPKAGETTKAPETTAGGATKPDDKKSTADAARRWGWSRLRSPQSVF